MAHVESGKNILLEFSRRIIVGAWAGASKDRQIYNIDRCPSMFNYLFTPCYTLYVPWFNFVLWTLRDGV
jgi:hypothetical protein